MHSIKMPSKTKSIPEFSQIRRKDGQTERPTNEPTDQPTDRPTDRLNDPHIKSRDASRHLKRLVIL